MTTNRPTPQARPKETVTRLREPSADVSRHVATSQMINGVLMTGILLSTEFESIAHPLGREPVGAFIVNSTSPASMARSYDVDKPSRIIKLKASEPVTVDIWVF